MALTATANSVVEDEIKILLQHPVIQKASMNHPNVALYVEELESDKSVPPAMQFGTRASEIMGSSAAIVYTDFIADIGPIVSSLSENGIHAVGYHGSLAWLEGFAIHSGVTICLAAKLQGMSFSLLINLS